MDVSGEVADLLVRETLQAGEAAVKLAATGVKNAAALLLALSRSDRKVVGRTSAKKLARDPTPAAVLPLRTEDLGRFRKLAGEYGILYVIAKPHGKSGPSVDLISTERYAAKLNALYQAMGYPLPEKEAEEAAKNSNARMLVLETQTCNRKAVDFYLAMGFRPIGFDLFCYTNSDPDSGEVRLEMAKPLN